MSILGLMWKVSIVDAPDLAVAVVVPAYRPGRAILDVLARLPDMVSTCVVVDDGCPDGTGQLVLDECHDPRVHVLFQAQNEGVGGATIRGYREVLRQGADIAVKLDADGQMDPRLVPALVAPIMRGEADYVKGNRFFDPERVSSMPLGRKIGNGGLSLLTKISSGYWDIVDPTNGFTAIHTRVLTLLPLEKISKRYFFESDMLFRLGTLRALVLDAPMAAVYGDEHSHLVPRKVVLEFAWKNLVNAYKRVVYVYFVRGFSIASIELVLGFVLTILGAAFGAYSWLQGLRSGTPATPGTVMLAGLPVFLGVQFLLGFLNADMRSIPGAVHLRIPDLHEHGNDLESAGESGTDVESMQHE